MSQAPENLIEILRQSLRHTQIAENNRIARLDEVKAKIDEYLEEAERIVQEISALRASARQTEAAIKSLSKDLPDGIEIREQ